MTHTPGPWNAYETTIRERRHVIAEIANQGIRWPRSTALANARLIAAAPEMLHALYDVKFTLESVKPSTTVGEIIDLWETVEAVINKAEGR